jgi:molybdopterin molybdotransferase
MTDVLRTVDAAQAAVLDGASPLPVVSVPLDEAHGRILAADVHALHGQPRQPLSAMDGYAIAFADVPGPWRLVGESAAGHGHRQPIGAREAIRIFTGAPLPPGADTVLPQEEALVEHGLVHLSGRGPARLGQWVRPPDLDFARGALIAAAGIRITAPLIGLAAAAGHGHLPLHRTARVAVLATGDELVPAGVLPGPDQTVDSITPMLHALLARAGVDVVRIGIAADRADALAAVLDRALTSDLLLTVGGASVGDHDLVQHALRARGAELDFWQVAMRPGKPLFAGRLGAMRVIGLPGNPVSAYVCALLFAAPLIRRLGGDPDPLPATMMVRVTASLPENGPRRHFMRARLRDDGSAEIAADQDSSLLSGLAACDLLLIRPEGAAAATAGSLHPAILAR